MRRFIRLTFSAVALALVSAALPASRVVTLDTHVAAATSCENLASLALPDTTITLAETVAAGAFTPPPPANGRGAGRGRGADANPYADVPAFCRVTATLKPSADSDIKMELWMPASGWNGKYQTAGNGGYAGNVGQNALAAGVKRGYAIAGTDTGHVGGAASMAGHPEKMIDFAHRALHETTVTGEGHGRGVLRQRSEIFVLRRVLDRRTPGAAGGVEVPRGLQRHRRRRSRDLRRPT